MQIIIKPSDTDHQESENKEYGYPETPNNLTEQAVMLLLQQAGWDECYYADGTCIVTSPDHI